MKITIILLAVISNCIILRISHGLQEKWRSIQTLMLQSRRNNINSIGRYSTIKVNGHIRKFPAFPIGIFKLPALFLAIDKIGHLRCRVSLT